MFHKLKIHARVHLKQEHTGAQIEIKLKELLTDEQTNHHPRIFHLPSFI